MTIKKSLVKKSMHIPKFLRYWQIDNISEVPVIQGMDAFSSACFHPFSTSDRLILGANY